MIKQTIIEYHCCDFCGVKLEYVDKSKNISKGYSCDMCGSAMCEHCRIYVPRIYLNKCSIYEKICLKHLNKETIERLESAQVAEKL